MGAKGSAIFNDTAAQCEERGVVSLRPAIFDFQLLFFPLAQAEKKPWSREDTASPFKDT